MKGFGSRERASLVALPSILLAPLLVRGVLYQNYSAIVRIHGMLKSKTTLLYEGIVRRQEHGAARG